MVYTQTKAGKSQRNLPIEFKPQNLGKDAEFAAVTAKAHSQEHQLRLKESIDFEDPWWNKSVKDQVFVHHANDYHDDDDDSSWEMDHVITEMTQHLNIETKSQQRAALIRARADELAVKGAWGKKPRKSQTVWEDPVEFTKYTIQGVEALEDFTAEALERNLYFALQEYETSENNSNHITAAGLSLEAAELHQRLYDYRETLGGLEATEKLSEQFVKYSVKMRRQTEGGGSIFDGRMGDFLDACMKSNPTKVLPMLMFRADPNTMTEEDEPVFVMTMKKIIFSDATRNSEEEKVS
jgi:hypothetical protein